MQIRRITALLIVIVLVVSLAACGNTNAEESQNSAADPVQNTDATSAQEETTTNDSSVEPAPEEDVKVLILYFSANNTKNVDAISSATPMVNGSSSVEWVANIIHDTVGGDLVPIIPSEDYPLDYDELADYAKQERDDGGRPSFEDLRVDPTDYDTIFIGYPIWWYEMPMIMDTFFETYDFSGTTIIPFNTHAGSRDGGTYKDIQALEPNAEVMDGFAIRGEDAGKDSVRSDIEAWLAGLDLD